LQPQPIFRDFVGAALASQRKRAAELAKSASTTPETAASA